MNVARGTTCIHQDNDARKATGLGQSDVFQDYRPMKTRKTTRFSSLQATVLESGMLGITLDSWRMTTLQMIATVSFTTQRIGASTVYRGRSMRKLWRRIVQSANESCGKIRNTVAVFIIGSAMVQCLAWSCQLVLCTFSDSQQNYLWHSVLYIAHCILKIRAVAVFLVCEHPAAPPDSILEPSKPSALPAW